jgi:hypothetical protein
MFEKYVHSRTEKFFIVLLQALAIVIEWFPKKFDLAYDKVTEMKIETITLYGVFAINLAFIALVISMIPASHSDLVALVTNAFSLVTF